MKKLIRWMLCAALMTGLLCVPAFAAQGDAPERQGDFYVLVNGEYITFSDAVPQIHNNRSCLPFVAVFEQLGFPADGMTWNQSTKTVTAAKDGLTISLTIGQPVITLTDAQGSREITADTAPYVDPATNRTYVPFGLVADALGYRVGWDASMRAVILDDVASILENSGVSYTLMDQYLEYGRSFAKENQEISGKYAMDMELNAAQGDETATFLFDLDGSYTALSANSSQMQFKTELTMKAEATVNGEDVTEELGEVPASLDMELRGDLAQGTLYYQSAALSELMGQPGMADAWYKLDLAALYSSLGVDYQALMELALGLVDETDFQDYLAQLLALTPLTSVNSTTSDTLAQLNEVLGDAAFQKSGENYVNTLMDEDGIQCTLILTTKDGKINGCSMKMTAEDESFGTVLLNYDLVDRAMTMELGMDLSMGELGNIALSMDIDGTYQPSSKAPEIEPPAGAQILDLSGILDIPTVLPSAA